MALVSVNIGSNLGDRETFLRKAIEIIGDKFGYYTLSSPIESEPWGFFSGNNFCNIGMTFKSELNPHRILELLKDIEKTISSGSHRDSAGNYADREIDIDIIAIDENVVDTEMLTVPHRLLPERDFFLKPLMELMPDWRHPVNGKTAEMMLKDLQKEKR